MTVRPDTPRRPLLTLMAVAAALLLLVTACGQGDATSTAEDPPATPGDAGDEAASTDGTAGASADPADPPQDLQPVRIVAGGSSMGCFGPLWLAMQAGMFEEAGWNVELTVTDGGAAVSALASGEADIAFSGSVQVVQANMQGQESIKMVTGTAVGMAAKVVVSTAWAEEHGVTADSTLEEKVQALAGARIGASGPGQTADAALQVMLAREGLDPATDVEIIALGTDGQQMLAALANDQVDAFIISEPAPTIAEQNGDGIILIDPTPPRSDVPGWEDMYYCVGSSTDEILASNRAAVVGVLAVLDRAQQHLEEDPDAARQQLREWFADMDDDTFDVTFDATSGSWATDIEPTGANIDPLVEFWASAEEGRDAGAATFERLVDATPAVEAQS